MNNYHRLLAAINRALGCESDAQCETANET